MSFFADVGRRMDRDLELESKTPGGNAGVSRSTTSSTRCARCGDIAGVHVGDCPVLEELIA